MYVSYIYIFRKQISNKIRYVNTSFIALDTNKLVGYLISRVSPNPLYLIYMLIRVIRCQYCVLIRIPRMIRCPPPLTAACLIAEQITCGNGRTFDYIRYIQRKLLQMRFIMHMQSVINNIRGSCKSIVA